MISFTNQSLIPNENGPIQFYGELMTHFHNAVLDIIANTTSLTSSCRKTLFEAYSDSDSLYLTKLLTDSSHNIKDLGSFQKCKNDIYYSTINPTKSSKPIMNKLKFINVPISISKVNGVKIYTNVFSNLMESFLFNAMNSLIIFLS